MDINLNRDIIIDVDLNNARIDKPYNASYYNTDSNIAFFYVKLHKKNATDITEYISKEDADNYKVVMTIVRSKSLISEELTGEISDDLQEEKCAIYKFVIKDALMKEVGDQFCHISITYNDQKLNTNGFTYTVKQDPLGKYNLVLLNDPDMPLLKSLLEEIKNNVGGIDDENVRDDKSFSSYKTTQIANNLSSQIKEKGNKTEIDNIQQQVNNLVLGATGDGNNAEVIQARGEFSVLNDRMDVLTDSSINIANITNTIPYKLLNVDGTISSSSESIAVVTDFIEVYYGERVKYKGAWYVDSRSGVCGYDENYNFVKSIIDYDSTSKYRLTELVDFTIDDSRIKYIRASSNNIDEYPFELKLYEEIPKINKNEIELLKTQIQKPQIQNSKNIKTINNNQLLPLGIELDETFQQCLQLGEEGSFDDFKIESPYVWWDENELKYGMIYTGYKNDGNGNALYGSIGLAWSNDLTNWSKDANSPIFEKNTLSAQPDSGSVTGGTLWYEDGKYYLFYIGSEVGGYEGGTPKLCVAISTDLYNWTRYENNPIISPGGSSWYNKEIYKANIVKWKDDKYYMFINCKGTDGVNNEITRERIGYAISNDLHTWVMKDVVIDVEVGKFDEIIAGDPYIYDIGDNNIYMAYFGYNGTDGIRDGLAYTRKNDFPLGWKKYKNNPITNMPYKGKPCIIYKNGVQYHFYGCGGGNGHIGYFKSK